uniref:Uncharacterized protein n=1 Tax=Timema cristinae TaxID=61476 RepID=A0A7R9GYR1_TIMCR|nr:unnamed protein product [Timema cristinae]
MPPQEMTSTNSPLKEEDESPRSEEKKPSPEEDESNSCSENVEGRVTPIGAEDDKNTTGSSEETDQKTMTSFRRIPAIITTSPQRSDTSCSSPEDRENTGDEKSSGKVPERGYPKLSSRRSRSKDNKGEDEGTLLKDPSDKRYIVPSLTGKQPLEEDDAEEKMLDFDDVLPHIGEFGLYQKILFVLLAPFAFFVAFVYFTQIFITLVPEQHWCSVPELENLTVEQRVSLPIRNDKPPKNCPFLTKPHILNCVRRAWLYEKEMHCGIVDASRLLIITMLVLQ